MGKSKKPRASRKPTGRRKARQAAPQDPSVAEPTAMQLTRAGKLASIQVAAGTLALIWMTSSTTIRIIGVFLVICAWLWLAKAIPRIQAHKGEVLDDVLAANIRFLDRRLAELHALMERRRPTTSAPGP